MDKIIKTAATSLAALALLSSQAFAATTLTGFGGATVSGSSATLMSDLSDADATNDYSGVGLGIHTGMLFSNMTTLSTTYNVTDDDCMGGSPRFQVHLNTPTGIKTMHVYLGPAPNFTGCSSGDQLTGNLIGTADARFDLTQFGGPFYGTYTDALSYVGNYIVEGVQLIADAGWAFADSEQTVTVSNPDVAFRMTKAQDQCKNGGWQTFTNPTFKNQGQCVANFASGGKNIK